MKKLAIDMADIEVRKDLVQNRKSDLYSTINEDGEDVVIALEQGIGMEMKTFQNNGWVRVNYYDAGGAHNGETFAGRWKKN
ncbi:hypothetical protein Kirov_251 [Bacillus phage Kirov]|uniref:Uncharacterized protein n=1 Tax=Bacillus phage Kirov TaxID=2783539 RepID=A0A7U3NK15_9CAUD|nr:hypothetical protein PQE67_gp053 [Bacillus phage Kirov]QOV08450.1 hypothetical protein Kirov_251 [Bacillus phage Kirov]